MEDPTIYKIDYSRFSAVRETAVSHWKELVGPGRRFSNFCVNSRL